MQIIASKSDVAKLRYEFMQVFQIFDNGVQELQKDMTTIKTELNNLKKAQERAKKEEQVKRQRREDLDNQRRANLQREKQLKLEKQRKQHAHNDAKDNEKRKEKKDKKLSAIAEVQEKTEPPNETES